MGQSPLLAALIATAFALSACGSSERANFLSQDRAGFGSVSNSANRILGKDTVMLMSAEDIAANAKRVQHLVHKKTIGPDTAVQIALLNNRGLQASYAQLGVSSAEAWQSIMQPNPIVSLGVIDPGNGDLNGFRAIEGMIAFNLLAAFTREDRSRIAETRFMQDQLRAVEHTLGLAAETRRAWIEAVAAFEAAGLIRDAESTANASSELAARLGETGFLNKAEQAREHAFYAELSGQRAKARLEAQLAKERLSRLLGLWGADLDYYVPNALPGLPGSVTRRPRIEADALKHRVDLAMARLDLQMAAQERGLTEATRYTSDLELIAGLEHERELEDGNVESHNIPMVEVEFEIPLFDSGKARLKKAEAAYLIAAHILAEQAVNVRSEARTAYSAYVGTYRIARHYRNAVLPLRRTIEEESLLSYNAMITSTFELLADTRERLNSNLTEAMARRDFWLADADLLPAIYGGGGAEGRAGGDGGGEIAAGGGAGH